MRASGVRVDERATQSTIRPGEVLGGTYKIEEPIGAGSMGSVYRAVHTRLGQKRFAVKTLHPSIAQDAEVFRRFRQEAMVASALHNPHIVEVFDFNVTSSGTPYMVMEFLDGETLGRRLSRRGRLPLVEARAVVLEVLDALAAAHAAGIVHRDIKPENIFLSLTTDGRQVVKVLDFGISKLMAAGSSQTHGGAVIGTPAYMSPEQATGNVGAIDARTDVFALGAVSYEMLTGRRPFDGDSPVATLYQVLQAEPPAAHTLAPELPTALSAVLRRALAKSPEARYQDVGELRFDFQAATGQAGLSQNTPSSTATMTLGSAPGAVISDDAMPRPAPRGTPAPPLSTGTFLPLPTPFSPPTQAPPTSRPAPTIFGRPDDVVLLPSRLSQVVAASLPVAMVPAAELLTTFLGSICAGARALTPGLLQLDGAAFPESADCDFYTVFMGPVPAPGPDERVIATMQFVLYAHPLEEHLATLPADRRKVVVVVVDTPELGSGVRAKIVEYRQTYAAFVIPIYLGELRARGRSGGRALFEERLAELHTAPDVFAPGGNTDATRCFGMHGVVTELVTALEQPGAFLVIHGPPGSGKTSLTDRAHFELPAPRFARVRCNALFGRQITRVLDELDRPLGLTGGAELTIAARVERLAEAASARAELTVLVLEDADWLIVPLAGGDDAALTAQARELWTCLAHACDRRKLRVLVTGIRGFVLKQYWLGGWQNPVATSARRWKVPALEYAAAAKLLHDLGLQMNVGFAPGVMERLHAVAGGNVHVMRGLCSQVVARHQKRPDHDVLARLEIDAQDLDTAIDGMTSDAPLFQQGLWPSLAPVEQRVLQVVSHRPPRDLAELQAQLASLPAADVSTALDSLREMGLVERHEQRERVALPLLAAWVRRNKPTGLTRSGPGKLQLLGAGLALTIVFAALYVTFRAESHLELAPTASPGGCSYSVGYPVNATPEAPVTIFVNRGGCKGGVPATETIAVSARAGTALRAGTQVSSRVAAPLACAQANCTTAVEVQLLPAGVDDHFSLSLEAADRELLGFTIRNDRFASLKAKIARAFELASLVPMALALFLAFYKQLLDGLRKLPRLVTGKDTE